MKKLVIAALIFATVSGNAQTMKQGMGSTAQNASSYSYSNFAWGIGLGSLIALGLVVGFTVGAATESQSSH